MLFTICFFELSPSVIASSAHPFSLSQSHSGTVSLCYSVGLWRLQDPVNAVMQHWCVMQHERTLIALTFCQHFYSLFKGLHGESAGACIRLHLEGSLKAAFSPREREGGWNYCSRWNNGSCGATCSVAHMNGRALGCVWVSGPGSPSQSPFPSASQWTCTGSGLLGVTGQPLLSCTSKHINIYKSRGSHWPCLKRKRGWQGGKEVREREKKK